MFEEGLPARSTIFLQIRSVLIFIPREGIQQSEPFIHLLFRVECNTNTVIVSMQRNCILYLGFRPVNVEAMLQDYRSANGQKTEISTCIIL